jgi:hypothetical protein
MFNKVAPANHEDEAIAYCCLCASISSRITYDTGVSEDPEAFWANAKTPRERKTYCVIWMMDDENKKSADAEQLSKDKDTENPKLKVVSCFGVKTWRK